MGLDAVRSGWKTTKAMRCVGLKVGVVVEEDLTPAGKTLHQGVFFLLKVESDNADPHCKERTKRKPT